jgi:hypothetical protein
MRLSPYPPGRLSMKDVVSLRSAAKPHSSSNRRYAPILSRPSLGWAVFDLLFEDSQPLFGIHRGSRIK